MDPQQQHQQEMSSNSNTLENMLGCSKEKKPKPQAEHAQKCPRCESTNTKFCYYNNYSLSQPRYFCKSCRRYWTKGGTLRNVPVGGGCRKNKRSSSSSSKRSQSQDQQPLMIPTNQNPVLSHLASSYDSNDLTLAFARLQKQQQSGGHHLGFDHHDQFSNIIGSAVAANQGGSFLDALRCGYLETQTQNQNPNNFQNLYYGYEGNGEVENGSGSCGGGDAIASGEMVLPYGHEMGSTTATTTAVTVTTMKQEMCNDNYRDQGSDHQNRLLWGLPWQLNGSDHHQSINVTNNLGDLDSGRESWNGFAPSWHGLLNSPLM